MSATIYLTVGITFERYEAVHHPVDYNQVWKYYSSQGQFCISVSFLGVLIVQVSYFSLVSYVWKICLAVGITFDQYTAVHHPVDYNQVQKSYIWSI